MKPHSTNTTTPFTTLLRSSIYTTTPTHTTDTTATPPQHPPQPKPPYIILLQHSFSLPLRLTAAEPSASSRSYHEHQRAGLVPPKELANRDLVGGIKFLQACLDECVEMCGGRVVVVRCCDWSLEGGRLFRDGGGVVVDLASDPLGWDEEEEEECGGGDVGCGHEDGGSQQRQQRTIRGRIDRLHSIFQSIQQAIEIIHTSRSSLSTADTTPSPSSSSTTATTSHRSETTPRQKQQQQQTIPIIFDSISPLLLHHSIPKFLQLLQQLKRNLPLPTTHTTTTTTTQQPPQPTQNHQNASSPIILPTLTETLTPFQMRHLEDASDAVLTVREGIASIARRSGRMGGMYSASLGSGGLRLIKEVQGFEIRGGGEGELVLLDGGDGKGKKLGKVTKIGTGGGGGGGGGSAGEGMMGKVRNVDVTKGVVSSDEPNLSNAEGGAMRSGGGSGGGGGGRKPIRLQHEDEEQKTGKAPMTVGPVLSSDGERPKPRIYMEDDDPEFDDLDEEDPDDDLDI